MRGLSSFLYRSDLGSVFLAAAAGAGGGCGMAALGRAGLAVSVSVQGFSPVILSNCLKGGERIAVGEYSVYGLCCLNYI